MSQGNKNACDKVDAYTYHEVGGNVVYKHAYNNVTKTVKNLAANTKAIQAFVQGPIPSQASVEHNPNACDMMNTYTYHQ